LKPDAIKPSRSRAKAMDTYDAVFVGSGINSLVGAAILAKAGWKVCILERNSWFGGAIRTAEITLPGFLHDLYSAWHPLFAGSEAYRILKQDLGTRGLEYLNTDLPTATLFPDGTAAFLSTAQAANEEEFERLAPGDGAAWAETFADLSGRLDLAFGLLGTELWSWSGVALGARALRRLGIRGMLDFGQEALSTSREWLTGTFASPKVHGLLVPWILHAGLGPENAGSGFMNKVMAAALQLGGMPVPRAGGSCLSDALVRTVRDFGGTAELEAHVDAIEVSNGATTGVRVKGRVVRARRAVVCNVTPQQLYIQLLNRSVVPDWVQRKANGFRYGRADMQIHLALSERPHWPGNDPRFLRTAIIHVNDAMNGVSRAVNEAERGLLPADPTVVVGQPMAVDSSRAPEGRWIFWLQLQELPSRPKGDAAGQIDVGVGTWTESLGERYADRVVAKLARQIPNLESAILKRVVLSPADLEAGNINLVGGDPYSGSCSADQFFILRPLPGVGHRTPIARLYHIGASTHPGPGLHGTSGLLVAKHLLGRSFKRRSPI
jgi:phytoene dehydrogenase-like protein